MTEVLPKDVLVSLGLDLWNLCREVGIPLDEINAANLVSHGEEIESAMLAQGRGPNADVFRTVMTTGTPSELAINFMGLTQWAAAGFPQVEMGHKFAAALLVSDVTPDALETVKIPWPAFMIEMPEGLLSVYDQHLKRPSPIRRMLIADVPNHHGRWAYVANTASGVTMWRFGCTAKDLLPPVGDESLPDHSTLEVTKEDERVSSLLGRLVINTCLSMSMPDLTKETGPGHVSWARAQGEPARMHGDVRRFRVGKPITIDLREKVAGFVRGDRGKVDVRTMVRGHFKRQHFGAGNVNVKVIWRMPYWRGPEEADVLVRPHVIKAE